MRARSIAYRCVLILAPAARRKVVSISVLQVVANLLDLLGVGLAGILGALTVSGVASQIPGSRILAIITFLGLEKQSIQIQVGVLGVLTAATLVFRTILSMILLRRTLFFLSNCGSRISSETVGKLLDQPITFIRTRNSQEIVFAITRGVDAVTVGVLGTCIAILSDVSLLFILVIALFVVDSAIAFGTLVMFALFSWILYFLLHSRAGKLGTEYANLGIEASSKIIESIGTYRELLVHKRRSYYVESISKIRNDIARSYSEIAFLPSISKYSLEILMVVGTLSLTAALFYSTDSAHALGKLAIFIAATSRIAPAALRIQQSTLQLKTSAHSAAIALSLIEELSEHKVKEFDSTEISFNYQDFQPAIKVANLDFYYEFRDHKVLNNISFELDAGSVLAIVGPSGAGKTTLIDLILGINEPKSGEILISGESPLNAINIWPGAMSYVPQETYIIEGTIRENITLGYEKNQISDEQIYSAIKRAQLDKFVLALEEGIETQVGEYGTRLSGGQKQRLGIARAIVTNPKLLVLDEATSSLDAETEFLMSQAIQELRGAATIIIVAHRLSTVKNADQLIYIDNGLIKAIGTFDQLKSKIPEFDNQTKLLGL
jgi:ABC-type multidrug transport system fused ATPase/permease subunit